MKPEKCLVWGLIISPTKARPFFVLYLMSCELGVSSVWRVGRGDIPALLWVLSSLALPLTSGSFFTCMCWSVRMRIPDADPLLCSFFLFLSSSLFSITLGISTRVLPPYNIVIQLFSFISCLPREQPFVICCPVFWSIISHILSIFWFVSGRRTNLVSVTQSWL